MVISNLNIKLIGDRLGFISNAVTRLKRLPNDLLTLSMTK
jgi:hypothetical protein